jgi:hypothetical protein
LGQFSDFLMLSRFGFDVPDHHIILGIEVMVTRVGNANDYDLRVKDEKARIVKAGEIGTEDKSNADAWPWGDPVSYTYGGPDDLWGETWIPSDIRSASFGFALSIQALAANAQGLVDSVSVTVYYTPEPARPSRPKEPPGKPTLRVPTTLNDRPIDPGLRQCLVQLADMAGVCVEIQDETGVRTQVRRAGNDIEFRDGGQWPGGAE